jgi:hypothetical protein
VYSVTSKPPLIQPPPLTPADQPMLLPVRGQRILLDWIVCEHAVYFCLDDLIANVAIAVGVVGELHVFVALMRL